MCTQTHTAFVTINLSPDIDKHLPIPLPHPSGHDNKDGMGIDRLNDFVPWCQRAVAIDALEHTRLAAVSLEKVCICTQVYV